MIEPIKTVFSSNSVTITLPEQFRIKYWSENYGEIQILLRNLSDSITTIRIDIAACIWVDPLPLLSLIISLAELGDKAIEFIIPTIKGRSDDGSYKQTTNKVLAFLQVEGFFDQLKKLDISFHYELTLTKVNEDDFEKFSLLKNEMYYTNCNIIPAIVVDLDHLEGTIDDWVSKLLDNARYELRNKISPLLLEDISFQIKMILTETLANIQEHAYENDPLKKKIGGFYVRHRDGLLKTNANRHNNIRLIRAISSEHDQSPRLMRHFIENCQSFIEIFVIDAGQGLSQSYLKNKPAVKNPFRSTWQKTVLHGERNNDSPKKTESGGLYSIARLAEKNFLWGRDANEFCSDSLPPKQSNNHFLTIDTEKQIEGLSLIYRIACDQETEHAKNWNHLIIDQSNFDDNIYLDQLIEEKDIYGKFFNFGLRNLNDNPVFVRDNRIHYDPEVVEFLTRYLNQSTNARFILYLPEKSQIKNKIIETVNNDFLEIKSKSKTLIIADIPVVDSNYFQNALVNADYSPEFTDKYDRIVLVNQKLSVLILQKELIDKRPIEKRPQRNNRSNPYSFFPNINQSRDFVNSVYTTFQPDQCLQHLIAWLKTHDSFVFWVSLYNKKYQNEFFINGNVKWFTDADEVIIKGYLNFAQTLTDDVSNRLYEISLNRATVYARGNNVEFKNIDILTKQIVSKINPTLAKERKAPYINILVGSVLVSGLSLKEAKEDLGLKENNINIHFFYHHTISKNASDKSIPHLFLWPAEWISSHFEPVDIDYRRVGRTHVIAPYGWKYYPVPRYRLYNVKTESYIDENLMTEEELNDPELQCDLIYKSVYECPPPQTYRDWQLMGKPILEIGHFAYDGKHDIFKIDFPKAVSESFTYREGLAQFLLSEFLIALGGSEQNIVDMPDHLVSVVRERTEIRDDLTKSSQKKLKQLIAERGKSIVAKEECAVIVYPYHYNTQEIVSTIKQYISSDLHDRIIALIPVNKDRGGSSFLISPLSFKAIQSKIKNFKEIHGQATVLLFDEATVEGKTRKEIKHLLFYLGATEVKTLCILDRRRLPFTTTDPFKHKAYWRLDIPRLGNHDTCLICKSLEKSNDLINRFTSSSAVSRIKIWQSIWEKVVPHNKKDHHGIDAKAIKPIEKKFGIITKSEIKDDEIVGVTYQCGGDLNRIKLTNSHGLTIYSAELHTMTSRDDIVFALIDPNRKKTSTDYVPYKPAIVIELLCVNLLLFGDEFSASVTKTIALRIFEEVNLLNEETNETALAALTLLSLPSALLENIAREWTQKNEPLKRALNFDMLIILCQFVDNPKSKYANSVRLKRFLKGYNSLIELNKQFHSEIYNDYGNVHDTYLQQLIRLNEASKYQSEVFLKAIVSCDKILYLFDEIDRFLMRGIGKEQMFDIAKQQLNSVKSKLKKIKSTEILQKYRDDWQPATESLFDTLKEIHHEYFTMIGMAYENEFKLFGDFQYLISEVLKVLPAFKNVQPYQFEIGLSANFKKYDFKRTQLEKWIAWDEYVVKKVKYIMSNVRHTNGKLSDPFQSESIKKDMWVAVNYKDSAIEFWFLNLSTKTAAEIIEEVKNKKKIERQHIEQLGGSIRYEDFVSGKIKLLKTVLTLPYI